MKINIYKSLNSLSGASNLLSKIDNSDFLSEHIVIVPDRFSLLCEKMLLENLPQKALFNVKVKTITSYSVELLQMMNIKTNEVLSSGEVLLLTQKAIDNVKEKLLTFKKRKITFTHEVTKLISQFKSCKISPEQLNDALPGLTGAKYHDLKLIYSEVQSLFNGRIDVNERLNLLNENFTPCKQLEKTTFYFVGFDAFTKEGYDFVKNLILNSKEVNFSLCHSLDEGNDYIFDKDIENNILNIAQQYNINVEVFVNDEGLSKYNLAIAKGVYSYSKVRQENEGFYNLYSAMSVPEEIEAVAKIIRYFVFNGEKYKNIQIAISDIEKYSLQIENIFEKYKIPYYIDTSVTADKTILGRLVIQFLDVATFGESGERLINLLSNICLGDKSELIYKCQTQNVDSVKKYKLYIEPEFDYADILKGLSKCKSVCQFNEVITLLLEKVKENFDKIMQTLEERGELKERNINAQMFDIFDEILTLLKNYDEQIDIDEYSTKLKLLLSFKEVSSVPTYVDGVMIGDATDSFFDKCNILFILGGQDLPRTSADNGLLSDEEMSKNLKEIEPTIRMINRRNRFKVFSLLTNAQHQLFVFYQQLSEEGKKNEMPSYITSLNNIFGQIELKAGNVFFNRMPTTLDMALLSADYNSSFDLGDTSFAKREKVNISPKEIMLKDNSARVTQLEQYYDCPFKHFANYGLKLTEMQTPEFDGRDTGNICHKGCELFIKHLIKTNFNFDVDIDAFINKNLDYILKDVKVKLDYLDEKTTYLRYIKRQLKSNFEDIIRELKNSLFRPKYLEKSFDDFSVEVDGENFTLKGRADRIDFFGDNFRIIDYKTGKTGNILKELYYGQKLQLFLYQHFVKEKEGSRPSGAFYFNGKMKFAQDDEDKLLLKGICANNEEIIKALDTSLQEGNSNLLSISFKDGEYSGNCLVDNLPALTNYSLSLAKQAIKDIKSGYIKPTPTKEACNMCKFAPFCGHEKGEGYRKQKDKINFED